MTRSGDETAMDGWIGGGGGFLSKVTVMRSGDDGCSKDGEGRLVAEA